MYNFDKESGRLLSQEHQRVAEIINDYDPDLHLVWIPPEDRITEDDLDRPFAIQHTPPNLKPHMIRKLRESEVNHKIIAWLWQNDQQRAGKDPVGRIEAERMAEEAVKLRIQYDQMMEKHELSASILASPLNTYKHEGVEYK
jgi:hypothetical protein